MFFNKPPKFKPDTWASIEYIIDLTRWFAKNDKQIQLLSGSGISLLFSEGFRAYKSEATNPAKFEKNGEKILDPVPWVGMMLYLDIHILKEEESKDRSDLTLKNFFRKQIMELGEISGLTLTTLAELSEKYSLKSEQFVFTKEIQKITDKHDLLAYKENYLKDVFLSSELRLMAWLYKEIFEEDFQFDV